MRVGIKLYLLALFEFANFLRIPNTHISLFIYKREQSQYFLQYIIELNLHLFVKSFMQIAKDKSIALRQIFSQYVHHINMLAVFLKLRYPSVRMKMIKSYLGNAYNTNHRVLRIIPLYLSHSC